MFGNFSENQQNYQRVACQNQNCTQSSSVIHKNFNFKLSCGHFFCFSCLNPMIGDAGCKLCIPKQDDVTLAKKNIQSIPLRLEENSVCIEHQIEKDFACLECKKLICHKCHLKNPQHKPANMLCWDELCLQANKKIDCMNKTISRCSERKKHILGILNLFQNEYNSEIERYAENLTKEILKRVAILKNDVELFFQKEKSKFAFNTNLRQQFNPNQRTNELKEIIGIFRTNTDHLVSELEGLISEKNIFQILDEISKMQFNFDANIELSVKKIFEANVNRQIIKAKKRSLVQTFADKDPSTSKILMKYMDDENKTDPDFVEKEALNFVETYSGMIKESHILNYVEKNFDMNLLNLDIIMPLIKNLSEKNLIYFLDIVNGKSKYLNSPVWPTLDNDQTLGSIIPCLVNSRHLNNYFLKKVGKNQDENSIIMDFLSIASTSHLRKPELKFLKNKIQNLADSKEKNPNATIKKLIKNLTDVLYLSKEYDLQNNLKNPFILDCKCGKAENFEMIQMDPTEPENSQKIEINLYYFKGKDVIHYFLKFDIETRVNNLYDIASKMISQDINSLVLFVDGRAVEKSDDYLFLEDDKPNQSKSSPKKKIKKAYHCSQPLKDFYLFKTTDEKLTNFAITVSKDFSKFYGYLETIEKNPSTVSELICSLNKELSKDSLRWNGNEYEENQNETKSRRLFTFWISSNHISYKQGSTLPRMETFEHTISSSFYMENNISMRLLCKSCSRSDNLRHKEIICIDSKNAKNLPIQASAKIHCYGLEYSLIGFLDKTENSYSSVFKTLPKGPWLEYSTKGCFQIEDDSVLRPRKSICLMFYELSKPVNPEY